MAAPRFLLVVFPSQGHINPAFQLAKHLLRHGAHVTFSTSISTYLRMSKSSIPQELAFANFSDGNDDGDENIKFNSSFSLYMAELERCGSKTLREQTIASISEDRSFSCIIYTTVVPWVADVARSLQIPSVLLWAQPATVLDIYYYYFSGYGDAIKKTYDDPLSPIKLPGIPQLFFQNLPSFIQPSNKIDCAEPLMEKHIVNIKEEPKVLVNTFNALEPEALKAIDKLDFVAVGPLTPALLDGHDPSQTTYGGDLFEGYDEYINWLNTKPEESVIYVAFGSINMLSKQQMEEMALGLLDTGRPFLWVIRDQAMEENEDKGQLSYKEELDRQGMIVSWCSQVAVLSHPSIGCFVTHCGWNSTLESLVCGLPILTISEWDEQPTNAKLVEDLWKTGIQLTKNDEGMVESNEINKCLEIVMGGSAKGEELRKNAKKWKELAMEARKEGGYLDKNLKAFIEDVAKAHN